MLYNAPGGWATFLQARWWRSDPTGKVKPLYTKHRASVLHGRNRAREANSQQILPFSKRSRERETQILLCGGLFWWRARAKYYYTPQRSHFATFQIINKNDNTEGKRASFILAGKFNLCWRWKVAPSAASAASFIFRECFGAFFIWACSIVSSALWHKKRVKYNFIKSQSSQRKGGKWNFWANKECIKNWESTQSSNNLILVFIYDQEKFILHRDQCCPLTANKRVYSVK